MKLPKSVLFVNFLPEGTTSDDLHFLFAPFGEITRIHVAQNVIAGWDNGFVAFASREEAELAMDELDGVETAEGRKLRIDWTKDSISLGT
ncbi:RNA recognition motif domain containing protein [Aphelenchoides avenae]|nr:RNA recognition motif domain containing protein [Aphelenchus avenae]